MVVKALVFYAKSQCLKAVVPNHFITVDWPMLDIITVAQGVGIGSSLHQVNYAVFMLSLKF